MIFRKISIFFSFLLKIIQDYGKIEKKEKGDAYAR